jgi:hypothetical protein
MCKKERSDWVWRSSDVSPPSTYNVTLDENPEVGRLHGPDGQLVKIVRAKPEYPTGLRPDRPRGGDR